MPKKIDKIYLRDQQIIFPNFGGRASRYNAEGVRTFSVLIEDLELAQSLADDGWNIKPLFDKDEESERPSAYHLPVRINMDSRRPPRIYKITEEPKSKTLLAPENLFILDSLPIESADMELNPYYWDVQGNTGIKAYCNALYVVIEHSPLDERWNAWELDDADFSDEEHEEMESIAARILKENE